MEPSRRVVSRRVFVAGVASAVMLPAFACAGSDSRPAESFASSGPGPIVDLPRPQQGTVALDDVLRRRRSIRSFTADVLTDAEIGQLLWAAQGVTADFGGRTAPSAGALYPLELHAVNAVHTMHYLPAVHRAEVTIDGDARSELMAAALDQAPVGQAPFVLAVAVVPARTAAKYGDRAGRYVDLEAGHAAQNVLLEAVALGLGAVSVGAFDDAAVSRVLRLPVGHEPRYLLAVGHPAA